MFESFLLFGCLILLTGGQPPCRFAHNYTRQQLLFSEAARDEYYKAVMYWEGRFFYGTGYDAESGITYDGHPLDIATGEIVGQPHLFTASSKESVHVTLLARILDKDPLAQLLISNNSQTAISVALDVLERKITSYEKFNTRYPGFGGYFPWVAVNNSGMHLMEPWTNSTPALDNGQLIWALVGLIDIMEHRNISADLTARYRAQLELMTATAAIMFYDPTGNVRIIAEIKNVTAQPTPDNYFGCGPICFLDDPYEGELFVVFMSLFAGLQQEQIDMIWKNKVKMLVPVDYVTPAGNITCQLGWYYSAHEMWKFMLLPYQDSDIQRRIFTNGERARTWDSALNNIPGLFAALYDLSDDGKKIPGYVNTVGIQSVAFKNVTRRDIITGYSTMPLFLIEKTTALIWYDNYLKGPKGQTPYGAVEGIAVNGTMISPLTTWDTKMTTVSAMMDGMVVVNRRVLQAKGVYKKFLELISKDYEQVFIELKGEQLPFALPSVTIPMGMSDFTSCNLEKEGLAIV